MHIVLNIPLSGNSVRISNELDTFFIQKMTDGGVLQHVLGVPLQLDRLSLTLNFSNIILHGDEDSGGEVGSGGGLLRLPLAGKVSQGHLIKMFQ